MVMIYRNGQNARDQGKCQSYGTPTLAPCLEFTRYFWVSWKDSLSVLMDQNNKINGRGIILLLNTHAGVIPTSKTSSQVFGRPMAQDTGVERAAAHAWVWIPLGYHSLYKHSPALQEWSLPRWLAWPRSQLPLFWVLQAAFRLLITPSWDTGNYGYLHIYTQWMEH